MILVPRPDRPPARRWPQWLLAAALAVVAHGALIAALIVLSWVQLNVPGWQRPRRPTSNKAVVLRGLTSEQWAKNRGTPNPNLKDERKVIARRDAPKKDQKQPDEKPEGQIVAVPKGNEQVDPNSKFIAETNNKADRQTKAKEQTAFYRNAMSRRTAPRPLEGAGTDAVDAPQLAGNDGLGQDDRPLRDAPSGPAFEVPRQDAKSEVAMKMTDDRGPGASVSNRRDTLAMQGNSDRMKITPGTPGNPDDASAGRIGKAGVLSLLPSPAVLDSVSGAAANDHLNDVEEGDGTYLSTREWKHASFFNRVKQSIGHHWDPSSQLRLRDPTLQLYGGRDRHTLLSVTLNATGQLKDVYVEKSSGLDFLDLEAIRAFERAQPFPNPPPGLLAVDQTVHFQFGFFLEMSGRPGLRLFRSTN